MAQAMLAATQLVSLADAIAAAPADHRPAPGFEARLAGPLVGGDVAAGGRVTAVLERTAVVQLEARRKGLARIPDVLVDPAAIEWVPLRPRAWADRSPSRRIRPEPADPGEADEDFESDAPVQDLDDLDDIDVAPEPAMPAESPPPVRAAEEEPSPPAAAAGDRPAGLRSCGSCGRPIPGHNRSGICGTCRSTCPSCGGGKAPQAERCRSCAGRARGQGGPPPAELAPGAEARGADSVEALIESAAGADVGPGPQHATAMPAESALAAPEPQPSPAEREGSATTPGAAIELGPPVVVDQGDAGAEAGEAPSCEHCGRPLPRHNRQGVCTLCQSTCPGCDGPKAIQAERCRACSRGAAPGPVEEALAVAGDLEGLPAQVQELLDQVVTLARYAQALEDELERHRAAERRMRRLGRRALAALESRP